MNLVLIADTFPPLRTSGAVQLRDLSLELVRQGHRLTVMLPCPDLPVSWQVEDSGDVRILRLKAFRAKDTNYVWRTIAEFLMPFAMHYQLKKSPVFKERWDGVIWYSPSIFHGPLVKSLKKFSSCKAYLILRDIFPEWAVDVGLMKPGLLYKFFAAVAQYQYSVADVIGVQSVGNKSYFSGWERLPGRRLEVLQNWLDSSAGKPCSIQLSKTRLSGRKFFVYAGNMGVAQGMDILIDLVDKFQQRTDVGFAFVGRGSDVPRLRSIALARGLQNVLFYDEIHPDEIPGLYSQCVAGIVSLDARHRSHNIPGKFLTYMRSGLPVLAIVNNGNDLAEFIRREKVGQVCENHCAQHLFELANLLLSEIDSDNDAEARCKAVFERVFSVETAARQIGEAITP